MRRAVGFALVLSAATIACGQTDSSRPGSQPPRARNDDATALVLHGSDVPAGFRALHSAPTLQDLHDQPSAAFAGPLRQASPVQAAFAEFRNPPGNTPVASERRGPGSAIQHIISGAYVTPSVDKAKALYAARLALLANSIGYFPEPPDSAREKSRTVDVGGDAAVLVTSDGENGEGAQAVIWRDGAAIGIVAVDAMSPGPGSDLALRLARRQESGYFGGS